MTMRSQKTEAAPSPDLDEEFLRDAQALCDFISSITDDYIAALSKVLPLPITGRQGENVTEEPKPRTAKERLQQTIREDLLKGIMKTDFLAAIRTERQKEKRIGRSPAP